MTFDPVQPKLIPGEPDKISVWFLGRRETIDRAWYDMVRAVAAAPNHASARAIMKGYNS